MGSRPARVEPDLIRYQPVVYCVGRLRRRAASVASVQTLNAETTRTQMTRHTSDIALGIDVGGERKGFHAVALNSSRKVVGEPYRLATAAEIGPLIAKLSPAVVAIPANGRRTNPAKLSAPWPARASVPSVPRAEPAPNRI